MNVGVCKIILRLYNPHNLKEKRKIVSSLCAKIRNRFEVSIAEVDNNDKWRLATVGVSCVSNANRQAERSLRTVVTYIEETLVDVEIVECDLEIISGF